MKKILIIIALMFAFVKPAHAQVASPPCFPFGCGALGAGSSAVTVPFIVGFAAFALLPVAIVELQDQNPWGEFPVHEESFPKERDVRADNGVATN